jgi:protein LSM14
MIQLITNAHVRYEGTLMEVDKTERSMKLKDVRSFGTEGRRNGVNEVDPSD